MFAAAASSKMSGRLMAVGTIQLASSLTAIHFRDAVDCEASSSSTSTARLKSSSAREVNLRKRMTPLGRFSVKSETKENPSIPTFFMAFSGGQPNYNPSAPFSSIRNLQQKDYNGLTLPELEYIFKKKDFFSRHERFQCKISENDDRFFEPSSGALRNYFKETLHYSIYRSELKRQIEHMLTANLDLNNRLWEARISNGALGSSGAISAAKVRKIIEASPPQGNYHGETVILFRAHHALGDGVSLGAAIADLSDEAEEFRESVQNHVSTQRSRKTHTVPFFLRLLRSLQKIVLYWIIGSIRALGRHFYLILISKNPFDQIILLYQKREPTANVGTVEEPGYNIRSVSWCDAAPIDQVKQVARSILPYSATINDVFVACVAYAALRQLEEHQDILGITDKSSLPKNINVVVPMHLAGGVLLPGESVGNRIGAFVARVPAKMKNKKGDGAINGEEGIERLKLTSQALTAIKNTPAAWVAYFLARFSSTYLSESLNKSMFLLNNCNATAVVSNVRGPPNEIHWNGRNVVSMAGFLPLPPGIPIGVVVQSYNGMVSLTVTANSKAVPDADKFLTWMLEEYQRMCKEANLIP